MKHMGVKVFAAAAVVTVSGFLTWHAFGQDSTSIGGRASEFSGASQNGSFDEALSLAISAAHDGLCPGCADYQVQWKLVSVSGRNGGFAYMNEVTVTIAAR